MKGAQYALQNRRTKQTLIIGNTIHKLTNNKRNNFL